MPRGGARPGAGRKPGVSNIIPTGESKTLAGLARKHTKLAIKTLAAIAKSGEGEAARVAASIAILDRGYGRPPQSVEHAGPGGSSIKVDLSTLPDDQLAQLRAILGLLAVSGRGRGGNPEAGNKP